MSGRTVELGLVAESLIFYDQVVVGFSNAAQFSALVSWFRRQSALSDLTALLFDGTIIPYYYAFHTLPAEKNGVWTVYNVQDQESAAEPVFVKRILESNELGAEVVKSSRREELCEAAYNHHIEVKADEFGTSLENAREDYSDDQRASLLMQIVVDELYRDLGFITPPQIAATTTYYPNGLQGITWGIDFGLFAKKLGPAMTFHSGSPLAGAAYGAKTLWSASQLGSDLYVASPLTKYAAYKLEEGSKAARSRAIIERLVGEVAFPDVRDLVNHGKISVKEILLLRRKATKFREWLRSESQFDRNAVLAYLGELARDVGWTKNVKKLVSAIGVVGGSAAGGAVGGMLAGAVGGAAGGIAGEGVKYILQLAGKIDDGWKPKVFGDFASDVVAKPQKSPQEQ